MTNRRRFLALLGIGTASAPLAAKAAMEAEQINLTSMGKMTALAGGRQSLSVMAADDDEDGESYQKARDYIRLFGVPAHIERSVKERSKYIDHLDFDIVNKRSWSLAAKVHEQRQRNYARSMEHYRDFNWYGSAQIAFKKISGFKWPW